MEIKVLKRSGKLEAFDADKINETLEWACSGLEGVSPSQVAVNAKIQFFDGITSELIQKLIIKSAADLIGVSTPNYQYVAGRLLMFDLRKKVYGQYQPDDFYEHIYNLSKLGKYDPDILVKWSQDEINQLGEHIDHERDMDYTYAAMMEWEAKYLVKDRTTNQHYESAQFAIMLIGMCLHQDETKDKRVQYVKDFYDVISKGDSLPTPIMAGVRTPTRQFSSCVLIEAGDSLNSINATSSAIVNYASKRAGIGINGGNIRAIGSPIRGGEATHTGCIGFYKYFQSALKSCSQGALRGAAATLFYPFWHMEVESLLVLKNNKGTEDNRVRHLDYAVQFSKIAYERLLQKGNITLFSPHSVPELWEAFFAPEDVFKEVYERLEQDPLINKKVIKAEDLWSLFGNERSSTGRIYLQNVDHTNNNSPFDWKKAPIRQSNLCVAPETQILTRIGYVPIAELEGDVVDIWNGREFSEVLVTKTGEDQKLLKVTTSSGESLECTPYHKWYVAEGYTGKVHEKRTHELVAGDKLIKFDLPLIEGDKVLDKAYENGFFTADGCVDKSGNNRVYFYHAKRELVKFFDLRNHCVQELQNREYGIADGLQNKYFVPVAGYTIESRLKWLAGWLDGDGCVYRNGTNQQIVGTSIEPEFLREVQRMLQTLGVSAKVTHAMGEGYRKLPKNDGSGEMGDYWCQNSERLLITSFDVYRLMDLGLGEHLKRLSVIKRLPQRDAKQFVKIVDVVDEGRIDDTYCFRESKRGMGMFNGLLTGQCLEIALPTTPLNNIEDEDGEIALCTLAAFNLANTDNLIHRAKVLVRALDNLLDYQGYPVKAALKNRKRRTLGVGVVNYAHFLAKNGVRYSDGSAKELTHSLFEEIQFSLLKASCELAKEKGKCEWFSDTTYSQGILPIDRYNKNLDSIVTDKLQQDWEGLRKDIMRHGLRNSTLSALMPSETSSKISNATNGIEPIRDYVVTKGSKDGRYKQVAPQSVELYGKYESVWDTKINKGYIELVAIMQKWVDQTISANTNYDPRKYDGGKVPLKEVLQDLLYGYKLGVKTFYYHNTRDGSGEDVEDDGCASGACKL